MRQIWGWMTIAGEKQDACRPKLLAHQVVTESLHRRYRRRLFCKNSLADVEQISLHYTIGDAPASAQGGWWYVFRFAVLKAESASRWAKFSTWHCFPGGRVLLLSLARASLAFACRVAASLAAAIDDGKARTAWSGYMENHLPRYTVVGGAEVPSQKKAGGGKEQGSSLKLETTPAGPHMCQKAALGSDWVLGRPSNLPLMHQPTSHHDLTSNQQPSASLCFCMHTRHPGPQRLQP